MLVIQITRVVWKKTRNTQAMRSISIKKQCAAATRLLIATVFWDVWQLLMLLGESHLVIAPSADV